MGYASSPGNGLVIVHAGAWYNWSTFPQWNRDIVGGGARSHDRYGEFEVTVKDTVHPIMAGVPPTFRIRDELYHSAPEPGGAEIIPLAEGRSPVTGKVFPVVWVVKGTGKARIACITLGHDQAAHDSAEYQTLLKNAVRWAAEAK
jgi:type 1 glutamine amidotransferase